MNLDEKIVLAIVEVGKQFKEIKKISLFGSRARGDNTQRSDIDLALYFASKPDYEAISELEEIETLLQIDVTIMTDALDDKFKDNVKNEEVVIYVVKFLNKLENFQKAVNRLRNVANEPFDDNDIIRDSLIQRFEFCYELSWKTLKEYLRYNGLLTETMPRIVYKTAYAHNIINNEQTWLDMIKDRNVSSHEYDENYIVLVAERIKNRYVDEFENLCVKLSEANGVGLV